MVCCLLAKFYYFCQRKKYKQFYIKQSSFDTHMRQITHLILLLFLFFEISACKNNENVKISESGKKEVVRSKFARNYPDFNPQEFHEMFQEHVQSDSILSLLYSNNDYKPLWINDTLNTTKVQSIIAILSNIDEHGIPENLFPTNSILSITDSIDSGVFSDNLDLLYVKMAELEEMTTKAAVKYTRGMTYGFLNPKKLFGKDDYSITILQADSTFNTQLYTDIIKDPIATMEKSQPTDEIYLKMQAAYKDYENKKDIKFDKIENKGDNIGYRIGDRSKNISAIAQRLLITGEYSADSTSSDSLHQVLDNELLAAINTFRKKHSYPEDNEIGSLTIEALNRPFEYYQNTIQANMERYRWKRAKKNEDKHIEVNIAAFKLIAVQTDSVPLIMRVCVGSIGNKTPTLQSDIAYMNLNPVWNVPTSIARKEISVAQKKDRTYLSRNNMKLYKDGKEVDASSIDWDKVNPSKFGYTIKQGSGYSNSLGRIKFMFNNSFSVYLHDTPNQKAFGRRNRAISHGCVRVQRPVDLAFFCTSPSSEMYKDQLLFSIDREPMSKEGKKLKKEDKLKKIGDIINPKVKISLFIDYQTIYTQPNEDDLYYADDVYGYDTIILEALKK